MRFRHENPTPVPLLAILASEPDGERRTLVVPLECREDGEEVRLEGYAAVFNKSTQIGGDLWGWSETIQKGAFAATIKDDDIRALFNHDSNQVLGRNTAETLTLSEDRKGLKVTITPPATTVARDVVELIKRGDVSGMSFSFRTTREEWQEPTKKGDLPKRTLLEVKLFDVGPVTFPAYPTTSIAARDRAQALLETHEAPSAEEEEQTARAADTDRLRHLGLATARLSVGARQP